MPCLAWLKKAMVHYVKGKSNRAQGDLGPQARGGEGGRQKGLKNSFIYV